MLLPGTKLGPYEITAPLGAGGMGEVYRARDSRLARDVALKVLPEAFAADAQRMARFEREAKVLASLNHPGIASIYGLEESGSARSLVMELVEGPMLAERIAQGPIPMDDALPIARQICEGLEYAHERGIIHRDLKPANVKFTPEGSVKLLDFGLAKALEDESVAGDPSTSPTISRLATQAGVILGTAAYMSPEQARGRPADRRADIWAFGCLLYEMLTAKRAFGGENVSETLAAIMRDEPEWRALPQTVPPRIRDLLRRCLSKDPKQRLQAIGDARIAIEEVLSGADALADLPPAIAGTRGFGRSVDPRCAVGSRSPSGRRAGRSTRWFAPAARPGDAPQPRGRATASGSGPGQSGGHLAGRNAAGLRGRARRRGRHRRRCGGSSNRNLRPGGVEIGPIRARAAGAGCRGIGAVLLSGRPLDRVLFRRGAPQDFFGRWSAGDGVRGAQNRGSLLGR